MRPDCISPDYRNLVTFSGWQPDRVRDGERLLVHHPDDWRLAAGDIHFSGTRDLVEMVGFGGKRQGALFAGLGIEGHQLVIRAAADEKRSAVVPDVQTVHSLPDLVGLLDFALLDRYNGNLTGPII